MVREALPEDEPALLASFARAFRQIDSQVAPRTAAEWRWRTREHPWGARSLVALDPGGAVLAHFAAWPQRMRWGSTPLLASLAIDTFVDPAVRSGVRRAGLLESLVAAYVERWCGSEGERDRLAWGLPIDRAWRLGRARLGYGRIDALWILLREGACARDPRSPSLELSETRAFSPAIDALCDRVSRSRAATLVRDHEWLDWRWIRRPLVSYRVLLAHRSGVLRGACVWRLGELEGVRGVLLCEWLVPPEDEECAEALLSGIEHATRDAGAPPLVASFAPQGREFALFQARGFRARPARHFLAGRSFDPRRPLEEWGRALELSLSDTDLA